MMCRSACENLHKSCGYDKDMYRCGDPEYLYGYTGERPFGETELGKEIYFRYPYPGAPFRDNQVRGARVFAPAAMSCRALFLLAREAAAKPLICVPHHLLFLPLSVAFCRPPVR